MSNEHDKRAVGGMEGGPADQAERGTHGAFESEPDVTISPIEQEGISIKEAEDTRRWKRGKSEPPDEKEKGR